MDVTDINGINSLCSSLSVHQDVEVSIKWNIFDFSLLRNPMAAIARSPMFTVRDEKWSLGFVSYLMVDGEMGFFVELFRHSSSEINSNGIECEIQVYINKEEVFRSEKYSSYFYDNKICEFFGLGNDYLESSVKIDDFSVVCIFYLDKIPEEPYEKILNDAVILGTDSRANNEGTDAVDVLPFRKMNGDSYLNINRCPHGTLRITKNLIVNIGWKISDFQAFFRTARGATTRIPVIEMQNATWLLEVSIDEQERFCVQLLTDGSQTKYHHLMYKIAVNMLGAPLDFSEIVPIPDKQIFPPSGKDLRYFTLPRRIHERVNSHLSDGFTCTVSCTIFVDISKESAEEFSDIDFERKQHSKDNNGGIDILSLQLKDLFLKGEDSDFIFKVKDKEFHVHKAILSARSPLLCVMLHDEAVRNSNVIDIVDCEPDIFEHFLLYLYTGQAENLSWGNAIQLYTLGEKYDLQHLKEECLQFVEHNMCVDTFCDSVTLAAKYNLPSLSKRTEGFFVRNVGKIVLTPKWMVLMKENTITCNDLLIKLTTSKSK